MTVLDGDLAATLERRTRLRLQKHGVPVVPPGDRIPDEELHRSPDHRAPAPGATVIGNDRDGADTHPLCRRPSRSPRHQAPWAQAPRQERAKDRVDRRTVDTRRAPAAFLARAPPQGALGDDRLLADRSRSPRSLGRLAADRRKLVDRVDVAASAALRTACSSRRQMYRHLADTYQLWVMLPPRQACM